MRYIPLMAWEMGVTVQFAQWYASLGISEQASVEHSLELLAAGGPFVGRPHVDTVRGSRFANMKELRVQHRGKPFRVLFAFDPVRTAMLLVGGDKTGDERWYDRMIPIADRLYEQHLAHLGRADR